MAEKSIDLGLTALDELFMTDEGRRENKIPRIHDIPIELIDDFPGHPYKVRIDEDMEQLVESIRTNGFITPVTLRKKPDGRFKGIFALPILHRHCWTWWMKEGLLFVPQ